MNPTTAPNQFVLFINDHPTYEIPHIGKVGMPHLRTLASGEMSEIIEINSRVNEMPPAEGFTPVNEPWRIYPAFARCGDYAVTKMAEFIIGGWPSSALQLAECLTAEGQEHCVLIVCGDHVLDNRIEAIRLKDRCGLKWKKIQCADDPRNWMEA